MKPYHDIASAISEEALESIRECYSIPEGYVLRAPLPEQRPYQPQPSEISILVDALEAGLRFPLHPTIVECLRWWRISPIQMAPNSWRYLIAFLGECRGLVLFPAELYFSLVFASIRVGEVEGNPSLFLGNPRYDREVVGRGRAQSSFSGYTCILTVLVKQASDSRGKGAPIVDPESAQPEVEVMHAEASGKRSMRGSAPDPTATGRPKKQVKIAMRRHKAHRGEGSSRRADREREPEVLAWWPNLSYQSRVWDDSDTTSEFDRGVLHLMLAKDLYTLPLEVLIAQAAKQIMLVARQRVDELEADNTKLNSGLDELSGWLDEADKELNELCEGLVESQRQLKEQKTDRHKVDDELLKPIRENESLKAELPGKTINDYKQSVRFGWGLQHMGQVSYEYGYQVALASFQA
ncbi:hypothetical protein B296_00042201 [Ensete ventricosum]|uniref:Transposase (putative) gypsy type domain-containing protein n=1 Tax=Ensete ventricosum TaxID=4639 RepID=A0A426YSV4_ENSVE|nr:hypothetical protein B296_00042201 [Ensete ventricosum]